MSCEHFLLGMGAMAQSFHTGFYIFGEQDKGIYIVYISIFLIGVFDFEELEFGIPSNVGFMFYEGSQSGSSSQ